MKETEYKYISAEKFTFVNEGEKLTDKQFEDKPVGYFKDAWIRFRKNKASVIATVIIICIVLFAFFAPLFETRYDHRFMDTYYSKKGPRNIALYDLGINGSMKRDFSEKGLIMALAVGIGAEDFDDHDTTLAEGLESDYQPMLEVGEGVVTLDALKKEKTTYPGKVDTYLEVGFLYRSVEQAEYQRILDFQNETGIQVLYPLVENNDFNPDPNNANYWYKMKKNQPVSTDANGNVDYIYYSDLQNGVPLEDNYKRDENGNVKYYEFTGGGTAETAQYKIRVLYYNYYQYLNGFEPSYLFGTDSQGYDLMLRLAGAIQLSLFVAICVSAINFVIGALYGSTEGYYGGVIDLTMERISDILAGVPFVVVATLFQIHLSAKVGAIPSLLFAFVLTGWIGTASRVRTQFYRFKNQEFVMAARTLGASDTRIIWKHIFPNSLGTIITSIALVIPSVIFTESMLSYLGIVKLGTASQTSVGTLLSDASGIWTNYPHLMIVPAITISLLMICFNLFGNGLRDAFNPSLRGVED